MHEEYLTAREAREAYGISTMRMRQMLADGSIPWQASPLDKRVRLIARADLESWKNAMAGIPKPTRKMKKEAAQ